MSSVESVVNIHCHIFFYYTYLLSGMTVAHETIVARQCGLRVLGITLVTNEADASANPTHAEVLKAAQDASDRVNKYFQALMSDLREFLCK
ncbi:hypothetical protein AB6A40_010624 [Gnathostoma spinigerum]|uniref:purine-nucleoside phosphorylase n=1 Tax=Gnathostoma spinigerum TaxID=75299 RepID=A0ABD6EVC6_9BILA